MNKRQRAKQQKLATIQQYQAITGMSKRQARNQVKKKNTARPKACYSLISVAMAELQAIVDCHASIKSIISKGQDFVNGKVSEFMSVFGINIEPVTWCNTVPEMDMLFNAIQILWNKFGINSHNQYYSNLKKATYKSGYDHYNVETEFREHIQQSLCETKSFEGWKMFCVPAWKGKVAEHFYDSGQKTLRDIGNSTDFYIIDDEEELKRLNEL